MMTEEEHNQDFRNQVAEAARIMRIMEESIRIFQASPEVALLRKAYSSHYKITLRFESSRKYTRVHFPRCDMLRLCLFNMMTMHGVNFVRADDPLDANVQDNEYHLVFHRIGEASTHCMIEYMP